MNPFIKAARSQRGGTLVGLVIGILIGLAAALAVAVYVSHVPVPFVDRGVTRKPGQDEAEAERNKGWNPNAGLVGTPAPLPDPTLSGQPGNGPTLLEPGASDPSGAVSGNDPLGDLVRSKLGDGASAEQAPAPAAVAAVPPQSSDNGQAQPFVYFVQVGAFSSPDDANAQRAKVALMGMASQVTEREQGGRTVYRVRLGPFNQRPMAEATRDQLQKGGLEAALVRVER
ncbi:MAG: SPOR domain-containing protein [Burkholderiaceae bacterium]